MILFQRMATFRGDPRQINPWALEITQLVNAKTDFDVSLWQGLFGGPFGTMAWSTRIDSLTDLEANMGRLIENDEYVELSLRGQDWMVQPPEDALRRTIHVAGAEYVRGDVGSYCEITTVLPSEGHMADAAEFGVAISDKHSEITDTTVLFLNDAYGGFGSLTWMGMYHNAAELDAAAETIAKDPDYGRMLDDAGDLFAEGSATRALARRIA